MIDLTNKSLPNTVSVGGEDFSIYTDFRVWLKFEIELEKASVGQKIDIGYLFKNKIPYMQNVDELLSFSRPSCPLPRDTGGRNVTVLDYELDSDLIYSAFLGQYGVDLVEVEELHWHKFLAMLNGLNESTKLREVMGYRCYDKNQKSDADPYEELRKAWKIPDKISKEEEKELEEFNKMFGG